MHYYIILLIFESISRVRSFSWTEQGPQFIHANWGLFWIRLSFPLPLQHTWLMEGEEWFLSVLWRLGFWACGEAQRMVNMCESKPAPQSSQEGEKRGNKKREVRKGERAYHDPEWPTSIRYPMSSSRWLCQLRAKPSTCKLWGDI